MTLYLTATRLHFFLTVLFVSHCLGIKYNIWFKYPQPYNPSEPYVYCKENITEVSTSLSNCSSQIPIYANTLDSEKTYIPYANNQFDFCPSIEGFEYSDSDLVEWDDKIFRTSFDIKFMRNEQCRLLCKKPYDLSRILDIHRISVLKMLMTKQYYQHWFADNFPMSWCHNQNPLECTVGVPIGYYVDSRGNPSDERIKKRIDTKPDTFYLFNHIDFTLIYESGTAKSWGDNLGDKIGRITAIKIRPRSIKHEKTNFKNCALDSPLLEIPNAINYSSTFTVYHSYSVTFIRDDTTTATQRWDNLLSSLPESRRGKWFIITAILLVICFAIPFVFVLSRTLLTKHELFGWMNSKPLSNPNSSWQSIANDVFRSPKYPMIFASLIGSGVQYIFCLGVVEILTLLVHFSTSMVLLILITILLILIVGSIGGYISSRFYKSFGGENWKYNCLLTSAFNPIMLTAVLFLTRNFLLLESSSAIAFPIGFTPALFIILISYGLALPLTFAGSYFGFNHQLAIEYPIRPTANIREIPKQPIYSMFPVSLVLGGLVPFVSVWIIENYPYFNSGEFIITTASILICAETAIVFCYLHLINEDHRWWWRSYLTIGFAAVYYLIHCLFFIISTIVIDDLISALFYGLFSLVLSVLLFSLMGTIGFLVCFAFIWMTYTLNKPIAEIDYSTFPEAT